MCTFVLYQKKNQDKKKKLHKKIDIQKNTFICSLSLKNFLSNQIISNSITHFFLGRLIRCNIIHSWLYWLHFIGGAFSSSNGTFSVGLLRWLIFFISLHWWYRLKVHRTWRSYYSYHLWSNLGYLLLHVTNRQHQLGSDLLRDSIGTQHGSYSPQQQHPRLWIRSEGWHCDVGNTHRTHGFPCSLRPVALHTLYNFRCDELQVLAVVYSSSRHFTASL